MRKKEGAWTGHGAFAALLTLYPYAGGNLLGTSSCSAEQFWFINGPRNWRR
jgi:hypothetical protein